MRDDLPTGEGERREAARRRVRWLTIGALVALGGVVGFYTGYVDGAAMAGKRSADWSAPVGAGVAAVYLLACAVGSYFMNRVMDEVERQNGYRAAAFAGSVLISVYPAWYFLWRGGLVVEPIHEILFFLFWASLAAGTAWYRFR